MFTNISDRYGDKVPATIEDYRELNPEGQFEIDNVTGEIRERFSDKPGDFEVVARVEDAKAGE